MEKIKIICNHEPKIQKETSYEWLESYCPECWNRYDALKHDKWLHYLASQLETYELNEYGNYTVYSKKARVSGRSDGLWIIGAVRPTDLPKVLQYRLLKKELDDSYRR